MEEEGLPLQVDFEKAFDTVEHCFFFRTMEIMGFGEKLIKLVKYAFFGCLSYANINGYLSSPIYLSRDLHQGSPLNPILFLLISQIFSNKLEQCQDIIGLSIQGVAVLLSLFADDTDIFLQATKQCVEAVAQKLMQFGVHLGCKVNITKTMCTPLGKTKDNINFLNYLTARWHNLRRCSPILCFSESNARRVLRKWGDPQRRRLSCGRGLGEKPPIFLLNFAHAKTLFGNSVDLLVEFLSIIIS